MADAPTDTTRTSARERAAAAWAPSNPADADPNVVIGRAVKDDESAVDLTDPAHAATTSAPTAPPSVSNPVSGPPATAPTTSTPTSGAPSWGPHTKVPSNTQTVLDRFDIELHELEKKLNPADGSPVDSELLGKVQQAALGFREAKKRLEAGLTDIKDPAKIPADTAERRDQFGAIFDRYTLEAGGYLNYVRDEMERKGETPSWTDATSDLYAAADADLGAAGIRRALRGVDLDDKAKPLAQRLVDEKKVAPDLASMIAANAARAMSHGGIKAPDGATRDDPMDFFFPGQAKENAGASKEAADQSTAQPDQATQDRLAELEKKAADQNGIADQSRYDQGYLNGMDPSMMGMGGQPRKGVIETVDEFVQTWMPWLAEIFKVSGQATDAVGRGVGADELADMFLLAPKSGGGMGRAA